MSIQLDDAQYGALDALAKKCGLAAPDELIARQIDVLLTAELGQSASTAFMDHLEKVLEEDLRLLTRLAK